MSAGSGRLWAFEPPEWSVQADITEREGHERTAEATKYAIETGAKSTDHILVSAPTVTLEIGITDTPINTEGLTQTNGITREDRELFKYQKVRIEETDEGKVAKPGAIIAVRGRVLTGRMDRVRLVHQALVERLASKKLVNAETTLQRYMGLCLRRVSSPVERLGRISITVELEQLQFDEVATVQALPELPKVPNGYKKLKLGNKPAPVDPPPPVDPTANESVAYSATHP